MTLLETLVVVAITALLSAIAFPAMDHAAQSAVAAQARVAFVADLRMARAQAIQHGQPVTVSIAPDGGRYAVERRVTVLPATLRLRGQPENILSFYPDGSASGATIVVAGRGGSDVIRIAPATGVVIPMAGAR